MTSLHFEHLGFGPATVAYDDAWRHQRELHARRVADEIGDVVLLLEHTSVYTAGKRTDPADRPGDTTPVVEVNRGGTITWHGPGQLVGYPITRPPAHVYVVDYIRRLEEALIRVCADLGLRTGRVKGRSGVWVAADATRPERKIAALGVRVSRGVTMHGLALNCDCDLAYFDTIVPCGIRDAGVTSLSAELGRDVTVPEVLPLAEHHLRNLLSWSDYDRSPDLASSGVPVPAERSSRGPPSRP
ncbi:MAG: lipoyl(octanoyl) transferase LipB [Actinomycetota bacterium]|nr:lipoyl(octanoyl) transferase LipB [Actinomycetota bacterium]